MARNIALASLVLVSAAAFAAAEDGAQDVAAAAQRAAQPVAVAPAAAVVAAPVKPAVSPAAIAAAVRDASVGAPQPTPTVRAEDIRGKRYAIKLRNGRELFGVVRPDDPWEIREDGGYMRAVAKTPGTPNGVRLWYVGSSNGYMFIEASDITSIRGLGALESSDSGRIATSINGNERRAEKERILIRDYRSAVGNEYIRNAFADRMAETVKVGVEAQAKAYGDLLAKFPPSRWSVDTPVEIERRRRDANIQPTAEEQEFLRSYDDWRVALQVWKSVVISPMVPATTR
jgi:hypothetical protein